VKIIDGMNASERVQMVSFNHNMMLRIRQSHKGPCALSMREVCLLYLDSFGIKHFPLPRTGLVQVPMNAFGVINFDTERFINHVHRNGYRIDFWVINNVTDAQHLIALGADGIMSDIPHVIASVIPKNRKPHAAVSFRKKRH